MSSRMASDFCSYTVSSRFAFARFRSKPPAPTITSPSAIARVRERMRAPGEEEEAAKGLPRFVQLPGVVEEFDLQVLRGREPGTFGFGRAGGDPGLHAAGVAREVVLEPVEDLRDDDLGGLLVEAIALGIGEPARDERVELFVESFRDERLGEDRRTAARSAVERGVDTGVLELRAEDPVLDVVQRELAVTGLREEATERDELLIPDSGLAVGEVLDARHRIRVDDAPDRVGVVGVDPVGELLLAFPARELLGHDRLERT